MGFADRLAADDALRWARAHRDEVLAELDAVPSECVVLSVTQHDVIRWAYAHRSKDAATVLDATSASAVAAAAREELVDTMQERDLTDLAYGEATTYDRAMAHALDAVAAEPVGGEGL